MITTNIDPITGPGLNDFSFPEDTALFAIGDVHGQADALKGLCAGIADIDTGNRKRHVVFLGDAIDRGPASVEVLDILVNQLGHLTQADEVTLLPGNHELLLAGAIYEQQNDAGHHQTLIWLANGGIKVMGEVFEGTPDEAAIMDVIDMLPYARSFNEVLAVISSLLPQMTELMDKFLAVLAGRGINLPTLIKAMPSHLMVGPVLCVHAGINPKLPFDVALGYPKAEHVNIEDHWAWIRDPFLAHQQGWFECGVKAARAEGLDVGGKLVLHGHTIPKKWRDHPSGDLDRVIRIFDRSKTNGRICLDFGAQQGTAVGACLITDQGRQLMFQPCTTLSA